MKWSSGQRHAALDMVMKARQVLVLLGLGDPGTAPRALDAALPLASMLCSAYSAAALEAVATGVADHEDCDDLIEGYQRVAHFLSQAAEVAHAFIGHIPWDCPVCGKRERQLGRTFCETCP